MADPMFEPRKMQVLTDGALEVTWADGHVSRLPARLLRGNCGCAQCVDEISHRRYFGVEQADPHIRIEDSMPIGRYAAAILFSDLHDTGIFPYKSLRNLCPCAECAAIREVEARTRG
ncbi:MAG: DUF971 domain-containing protein [SAR202 cluster bacterium]|nr:DUF971 domain-containing protein [SAR202 cluster bacterium]